MCSFNLLLSDFLIFEGPRTFKQFGIEGSFYLTRDLTAWNVLTLPLRAMYATGGASNGQK